MNLSDDALAFGRKDDGADEESYIGNDLIQNPSQSSITNRSDAASTAGTISRPNPQLPADVASLDHDATGTGSSGQGTGNGACKVSTATTEAIAVPIAAVAIDTAIATVADCKVSSSATTRHSASRGAPTSPSVTATAMTATATTSTNRQRCARLRYSQDQVNHWKRECATLKRQQLQATLVARLYAQPTFCWQQLSKREKWSKTTVLTMLHMNRIRHEKSNDCRDDDDDDKDDDDLDIETDSTASHFYSSRSRIDLPYALTEDEFDDNAPSAVLHDKDVFLARMNTRQSQAHFCGLYRGRCRIHLELHQRQVAEQKAAAAAAATSSSSATSTLTTTNSTAVSATTSSRNRRRKSNSSKGGAAKLSSSSSSTSSLYNARPILTIPSSLVADDHVWHYVVERHACLLLSLPPQSHALPGFAQGIPEHLWHLPSFLESVCTGIRNLACNMKLQHHFNNRTVPMTMFQAVLWRFSPAIRGNRTLVQAMIESWARPITNTTPSLLFDFVRLLLKPCERPVVVPSNKGGGRRETTSPPALVRDDKSFALFIVNFVTTLPANALKAFSKELQNDLQFVTAAVTKNGLCLQHALFKFRHHVNVCQAACASNPQALYYCHVPKMRKDPTFVERYFSSCYPFGPMITSTVADIALHNARAEWDRRLYLELPSKVKEQADVSFAALCTGYAVAIAELPLSIQTSDEFWKRILSACPEAWFQLPSALPRTVDLVWAMRIIPSDLVALDIFDRLPQLEMDRTMWLKIVESAACNGRPEEFWDMAPEFVWHDKEIVLAAVREDFELLDLLHDFPLYEDRDVIAAALECNAPAAMYEVDGWVQLLYPDLVASFIRTCETEDNIWDIYGSIDTPLWHHTDVVHAWLSRGGDYLHDDFLPEVADDPEAFLLIAQHCPEDFSNASDALLSNKEFLSRVMEVNPTLLKELPTASVDFDLALIALGGSSTSTTTTPASASIRRKRRDLIGLYDINNPSDFNFWMDFAAHVHEQVASHDNFITLVLGSMTSAATKAPSNMATIADATNTNGDRASERAQGGSPLAMLNQGHETSLVYKKLLAEFSGVPIGNQIKVLRRAAANLVRWGY